MLVVVHAGRADNVLLLETVTLGVFKLSSSCLAESPNWELSFQTMEEKTSISPCRH